MKTIGIKIQKIVNINLVISGMNKLLSTKNVLYSSSPIIMFSTFNNDKSILPNGSCRQKYKSKVFRSILRIIYNYPPKGRWIVVDIYRDAKRRGIYPPLFTDPEGDSCFSIYQIRWIKKCCFNFFFWNFRETTPHFSLRSRNSEYPRIFRVKGANQSARKLLSTDLVNTKEIYYKMLIGFRSLTGVKHHGIFSIKPNAKPLF